MSTTKLVNVDYDDALLCYVYDIPITSINDIRHRI